MSKGFFESQEHAHLVRWLLQDDDDERAFATYSQIVGYLLRLDPEERERLINQCSWPEIRDLAARVSDVR